MIHRLKCLDLEITDFENYYDPTCTGEIIPSQTSGMFYADFILLCETDSSIPRAERA